MVYEILVSRAGERAGHKQRASAQGKERGISSGLACLLEVL